MSKYKVIVRWSDTDGAYLAEVPELPGCMAHGPTKEAARREAGQAMDLWIATAAEFGDPIPETGGERLVLAQSGTGEQADTQQAPVEEPEPESNPSP